MVAVRRILCPVDFSDPSHAGLRYAVDLAGRFGASVTLLHVIQPPGFTLPEGMVVAGADVFAELQRDVADALQAARAEAERLGAASVEVDTAVGATHPEIVRYAEEHRHDLIVMGTHGRTGIAHALLGSTAERVVRHAPCPVLTVRAAPQDRQAAGSQER
jgi:nucleotide-binding universal stress UspA family protein